MFWPRTTILLRIEILKLQDLFKREVAKITFQLFKITPSSIVQLIQKQMKYLHEAQKLAIRTIPSLYIQGVTNVSPHAILLLPHKAIIENLFYSRE